MPPGLLLGTAQTVLANATSVHDVYFKGTSAFWRDFIKTDEDTVRLLTGRYAKTPTTSQEVQQLAVFTDSVALSDYFFEPAGAVTAADTRRIGRVDAQGVRYTDVDGLKVTVYIAITGRNYPLLLSVSGKEPLRLIFDSFDVPVTIKPPPADQVITIPG